MSNHKLKFKHTSKYRKSDAAKLLVALVFVIWVIIPLFRMLFNIDAESLKKVFTSSNIGTVVSNSLLAAVLSTAVTVILAYYFARITERVDIKLKNLFGVIFVLPMLIPSISTGRGIVILLGNNGLLTRLLGINVDIYGLLGIVLGSVIYAFPIAYLMFADIMKYEDSSPYEAANVLGISKSRQFCAISLPYIRKPLISIVFAVFTLVITDYGIPLTVGGKFLTVPVLMYQEVVGQLEFGKGAVYGGLLLIPAVIEFIIDMKNRDRSNSNFTVKPFSLDKNLLKRVTGYVFCGIMCIAIVMPIVSFVLMGFTTDYPNNLSFTMDNFNKALRLKADDYLLNSVLIAFFAAILGVVVSFVTAYMTARLRRGASRLLHLAAITSAAVPGLVLGLSYVLIFRGSFFYGTIALLIIVNTVHFISSPYLMIYNSLSKLNDNLEAVGSTLGIKRFFIIRDVIVPQCKGTIVEMFSYFFVNCMMTISAVSFLSNTANKPVSLMINQFETQGYIECAAIVSLMILCCNLLVKGIAHFIKKGYITIMFKHS